MSAETKPALGAASPETVLTAAEWRAAMGYFPSGVTIVTSWQGDLPVASTINAFSSVSLDPPLLMISLDQSNPILDPVRTAGVFGVNILDEHSRAVAFHFARSPESDRFASQPWRAVAQGAPQLESAPVFIDCQVEDIHRAGDHYIIVGRGLRTEHVSTAAPLLYHRGGFFRALPTD